MKNIERKKLMTAVKALSNTGTPRPTLFDPDVAEACSGAVVVTTWAQLTVAAGSEVVICDDLGSAGEDVLGFVGWGVDGALDEGSSAWWQY